MKTAGYSGTPLAKKLGIKPGFRIKIVEEPKDYFSLFTDLLMDLEIIRDLEIEKDFIHYCTTSALQLKKDIGQLKKEIVQHGILWISWPKKTAKLATDLNGNFVREIGLGAGLVNIKVCAVNEIWSGLKFVVPVKDRKK